MGESLGAQKKRNPWAKKPLEDKPVESSLEDQDASIKPVKAKENKLPRWAQSVTGEQLAEENKARH